MITVNYMAFSQFQTIELELDTTILDMNTILFNICKTYQILSIEFFI